MNNTIKTLLAILIFFWATLCFANCDAPTYLLFNQTQANAQCPSACGPSGGWDGTWTCPSSQYCLCSCKGPCTNADDAELAGPK